VADQVSAGVRLSVGQLRIDEQNGGLKYGLNYLGTDVAILSVRTKVARTIINSKDVVAMKESSLTCDGSNINQFLKFEHTHIKENLWIWNVCDGLNA
jgi:hypothetical protein